MRLSQRLAKFTLECDRVFNHLLGYVIAFSALIAFADVLGDGKIMQYIPWLYWVWVIAQGLGVEFQVFVLIRRLPRLWKGHRGLFWANITFITALCLMSVLIGSIFVEHDNTKNTVEIAMITLGINHIGFVYARSALAILLVVLIGIDRAMEQQEDDCNTVQQLQALEADLTHTKRQIHTQLELLHQSVEQTHRLSQLTHQELSTVTITIEQHVQRLLAAPVTPTSTPITAEAKVRTVLAANPSISIRKLAEQAGVAPATAAHHKRTIQGGKTHD